MQNPVMNVPEHDRRTREAGASAASEEKELAPRNYETKEEHAKRTGRYLGNAITSIEEKIADVIDQAAKRGKELRSKQDVDTWYAEENLQYLLSAKPLVKANGEIDTEAANAHKKAGLSFGLFLDTCTVLPSNLNDAILNPGGDAYRLKARGKRRENKKKIQFWTQEVRRQIQQSRWLSEMKNAHLELVKHGTAVMRQSYAVEHQLVQVGDGDWIEEAVYSGMTIKAWPLMDVFVSHPNRQNAEDQSTVIWSSMTTLSELAKDERLWRIKHILDRNEQTEQPELRSEPELIGRYVGLDLLREEELRNSNDHVDFEERADRTEYNYGNPERISAEKTYRKLELQGMFPIGNLLRNGMLTPAVLDYYDVRFSFGGRPVEGEQAARIADSIYWYITVLMDVDGGLAPRIIELRPCPYRKQRTELLAAQLIQTGKFYGMGTYRIGRDIEEAADKVLNDTADILDSNANPKTLYSVRALGNKTAAEEALSGDDPIAVAGGVSPEQAIQYLTKPYDAIQPALMDKLIEIYNTRTMCSQTQKGARAQTESDTLGEAQQQVKMNERRLNDIIYRISHDQLIVPSLTRALDDTDWFTSDEELADRARKYSADYGWDMKDLFKTAEADGSGRRQNVTDEIEVEPAAMVTIGREIAIQFILQMADRVKDNPNVDVTKLYKAAVDLFGGFDDEDFFADPNEIKTPNQELLSIIYGDTVEPSMNEDSLLHYQEHQNQRNLILALREQYAQQGIATEAIDAWIEQLDRHIDETEDFARMQMQRQQAAIEAIPVGNEAPVRQPAEEQEMLRGMMNRIGGGAQ